MSFPAPPERVTDPPNDEALMVLLLAPPVRSAFSIEASVSIHSTAPPVEQISEKFTGPIALALSYGDVIAPAKIFTEFVKDLETIKIRGAVVEGKVTDVAGVQALAKMPGLPELRAKILGVINEPAAKLVRMISTPGSQLARVLKAREEALSKQG